MYWNSILRKKAKIVLRLIETWDVLKLYCDLVYLMVYPWLIETWDVLKCRWVSAEELAVGD